MHNIKLKARGTVTWGEIGWRRMMAAMNSGTFYTCSGSDGYGASVVDGVWYPNDGSQPYKYVSLVIPGEYKPMTVKVISPEDDKKN